MSKTELIEQETKPQGYMLTKKGLQAARRQGEWLGSLDDVILRTMAKSPDAPLTKGSLSEDWWQKASEILARLEAEGLVQKADSTLELGKPKVVIEDAARTATLKLNRAKAKPESFGLKKVVYSDKKGERLATKKHRGWKPVKY